VFRTFWWVVDMLRPVAVLLFLLSAVVAGSGHAWASCSAQTFEVDAKQALDACNDILKGGSLTDAERAQSLKIRARAFHRLNSLNAAIEDYETALALAPNDPELHLRRGWTAYDERNFELVFKHARRAIELKPKYADVFSLVGAAYSFAGKLKDAAAAYDQAIRLEPNDPMTRANRGMLLKKVHHFADALNEAEFILSLPAEAITKPAAMVLNMKRTTHRVAAGQERAELLAIVGRVNDARQAFDRAVQLDLDAQTLAGRASFNFGLGPIDPELPEFRGIEEDVTRSIELDPEFWRSRYLQAQIHYVRGRYDEAEREFARGIELYPINGRMRWQRAATLRKLGRTEDAQTEAIAAFEVDPGLKNQKLGMLRNHGYLPELRPDADVGRAVEDAVRACMLDEECG